MCQLIMCDSSNITLETRHMRTALENLTVSHMSLIPATSFQLDKNCTALQRHVHVEIKWHYFFFMTEIMLTSSSVQGSQELNVCKYMITLMYMKSVCS
jgi:hypothetical protein